MPFSGLLNPFAADLHFILLWVMAYLDHAATTPLDPEVIARMDEVMEQLRAGRLANPSSVHTPGRKARAVVNEARRTAADFLGVDASEIVFTASGTEGNNMALKGAAFAAAGRPFRLVAGSIEHECVLNTARWLALRCPWVEVIEVHPDPSGVIRPEALAAACKGGVSLVSVMTVNNETGVIQPVGELARITHEAGGLFHTDAVQAAGRMRLNAQETGCDLLTISAHKIHGPRGCGLLYVRKGTALDPLLHGGHQESGLRAGTEGVELIAGFAEALRICAATHGPREARMRELESALLNRLEVLSIPCGINGGDAPRTPGLLNLSLGPGLRSHDLVAGMDIAGHAISAGSACSSGVIEPSRVLRAMGVAPGVAASSIRISFGRDNTIEEAVAAADELARLAGALEGANNN